MEQSINKYGFTLQTTTPITEIDGVLYRLRHERTGLELIWLKRPEENKTFGIAFETLPWDDTGVFHILEHSVLCGSDKYPVKEPFVELMKRSMNTFLNAMTFPDKTFYPISSRNHQDFLNLTRVYLDAVFHPLIYSRPEIFYQEGWHYEFDSSGRPSYKGIVFNEMKGAFANADELLSAAMNRALFPDSPYGFISGGDSAKIPDLSYEAFLDSHRRFYSPSNAYVFLDGDLDLDEILKILEEEYLQTLKPGRRQAPPALQPPVAGGEVTVPYALSGTDDGRMRYRLAWCGVIGMFADREKLAAMQLLAEVLCGNNHAPLSDVILSRGLAEDVSMGVQDGVMQPCVVLEVRHFRQEDREEIEMLLLSELRRLAADGIDHGQLRAAMANMEFHMRERDFGSMPQGLVFGINVLDSWLYGGDPAANLEIGDLFTRLEEKLDNGYFEQLIEDILLENPHSCKVLLVPSHSAGEDRRRLEAERLLQESGSWSRQERQLLMERQRILEAWQAGEDTPEALETMPRLTLGDLSPQPEPLPTEYEELEGIPVLEHLSGANGIVCMNLYFDMVQCTEAMLSELSFLSELLGSVKTDMYSEEALAGEIRRLCGRLQFSVEAYENDAAPQQCTVKLRVSISVLKQNMEQALVLVCHILTGTRFDDEASVLNLLRQSKIRHFQQIVMSGAVEAAGHISAQYSTAGVISECVGGFNYYQWLSAKERSWHWEEFRTELDTLLHNTIHRDTLTLSITDRDCAPMAVKLLGAHLPAADGFRRGEMLLSPWGPRKEGIIIPADISFAAMGGSLLPFGGGYSGEAVVACKIISLSFLWNVIRVQGGAYGTGMTVGRTGTVCCYSHRDPSAAQSLNKYPEAADFLREFCGRNGDITDFIISAASEHAPLLTLRTKALTADRDYFSGRTWDIRCRQWKELLDTAPEKLAVFADILAQTLADGGICVVGSEEQINACRAVTFVESL